MSGNLKKVQKKSPASSIIDVKTTPERQIPKDKNEMISKAVAAQQEAERSIPKDRLEIAQKAIAAQQAEQKINEKYAQLGERFSPLGRPLDSKVQFDGVQFFKNYRGGQIFYTREGEVIAYQTYITTVRFRGIHCFGKSEAVDEPYAIVGVYSLDDHDSVVTKKFPVGSDSYENFVASTDASESIDVRTMLTPQDIAISCTVMEHDSGDPDRAAASVEEALKKAASDAGVADAADINTFTGVLDDLKIPNFIASVFGVGDDIIGSQTIQIHYTELDPKPPMKKFGNISYNFESPLLSDGDASYKIYFEVFTSVVQPPHVL